MKIVNLYLNQTQLFKVVNNVYIYFKYPSDTFYKSPFSLSFYDKKIAIFNFFLFLIFFFLVAKFINFDGF